jgi:2-keto-4-pentenoate hydratase
MCFLDSVINYIHVASLHIFVFVMVQDEEGEVISRLEVFNSVEVLAPGIELDDVDSLLNSGESNSSSTVTH